MMIKTALQTSFLFVFVLLAVHATAWAQTGEITGVVTDSLSGVAIPGANVVIVGTTQGAATDPDGNYTISGLSPGTYDVEATFVGYAAKVVEGVEVSDGEATRLDFELVESALELEEVVAIGYGVQQRDDVTGSVGVLNTENIQAQPLTSPDQALMGQISGVNVTLPTGMPGSAPQIQVRGVGAIGAGHQPLFVVDGFALPQPDNQVDARFRNPLADIPAEDIESITVLKDASATAIYGSRASNGVVIITTKGGVASAIPQVGITAYTGVQGELSSMRPRMANAQQFATWQNLVWQNRVDQGQASEIPEVYRNPEQLGEGTDWYDLVRRTAYIHNFQASVQGGSEAVRSYISAGIQHQQGILPDTDFTRVSLRANFGADLSDRITAGLNMSPTYTQRNQPELQEGRHGAAGTPMIMCPTAEAYDEDGHLAPFVATGDACPGHWAFPNPLYMLQAVDDERNRLRALGTAFLEYEIVDGLSARSSLSADWAHNERKNFSPSTLGGINSAPPSTPSGSYLSANYLNWLSETTLNLNAEVGPGRLNALTGFTVQQEHDFSSTFSGNFPDDEIRTLNVASDLSGSSNEQGWSLMSYLARANYSLLDRFVLTGTLRFDGSSRFGRQNRWGTFPSGAIAWNIHNEPFMEGLAQSIIPQMRLRVSFGVTGNNQIGNYSHLSTVHTDDYLFGSSVAGGRRVTSLGNQRLGWERTNEWNVGLDASFFDHQVTTSVEVYQRNTTDLLLQRDLPGTSGFSTITENIGELRNRGIEISLNSVIVDTRTVTWATDLNWALNRNEVVSLPGGEPIFTGTWGGNPTHMTAVGQPIGQLIGLVWDGIYQNWDEVEQGPEDSEARPGEVRWRDVNGDGRITIGPPPEGDYGIIGNPHPDFTFGITNSLRLGRFDTRVTLTGRVGGEIMNFAYWQSSFLRQGLFNIAAEYVENMWISEDQPGTMPTPVSSPEAMRRFHTQHSGTVYSGTNLWVRNAMVRYNLPEGVAGVNVASIYLSVQNPIILTRYPGNPEVEYNQAAGQIQPGFDNHAYPISRQFTVGIELSL